MLLVDGPAHCFDMAESFLQPVSTKTTRANLGIDESVVVYVSGANFYKIIPELLDSWFNILMSVPNSKMVLYPFNPNWSSKYPASNFIVNLERMAKLRGLKASPFIIVPPVPSRTDILQLLQASDVYLDSFPYSGMTSILDPYDAGLPIIALEGAYQRERMASSALRCMGLENWIATTPEDYINRAINVGTDTSLRESMQRRLHYGRLLTPKFLDSKWFASEIGKLFC